MKISIQQALRVCERARKKLKQADAEIARVQILLTEQQGEKSGESTRGKSKSPLRMSKSNLDKILKDQKELIPLLCKYGCNMRRLSVDMAAAVGLYTREEAEAIRREMYRTMPGPEVKKLRAKLKAE